MIQSLADVTKESILKLIEDEVGEDKTTEYKAALSIETGDERKEFLADVCSFANTSGGFIFYGIEDRRDEDNKPTGIPSKAIGISAPNPDELNRRIEEIIRSGLSRTLSGVQVKRVDGFEKGPIFVLHVPKSWNAPHMVSYKGTSRFYGRSNSSKFQMTIDEIQKAFLAPEQLFTQIREFRFQRIGKILSNEAPMALLGNPKVILHLVPLNFQTSHSYFDVEKLRSHASSFPPGYRQSYGNRVNFDGFLSYGRLDAASSASCYTQVFRNGAIESVDADIFNEVAHDGGRLIRSTICESALRKQAKDFLGGLSEVGVEPPFALMVTLTGVKGARVVPNDQRLWDDGDRIERDQLVIPEVLIDSYAVNLDAAFRPIFDSVWNAGGFDRCLNYDDAGAWRPPH
jgi:hypothetical protein